MIGSDETVTLAREQQLQVDALWVEEKHGDDCPLYIAQQIDRLHTEGDLDDMAP